MTRRRWAVERNQAIFFVEQRDADTGCDAGAFANREHVRIFAISDAMKGDTNPLTDGGAAILEMNIERNQGQYLPLANETDCC